MTLSISRLYKLLSPHCIEIKRVFSLHGMCKYIEVYNSNSSDSFLIYVPSKYDIPSPHSSDTYKLKSIDVKEDGYIPGDYAGEPDNYDISKEYDDVNLESSEKNSDMVDKLESNYKRSVSLRDNYKNETKELRDVFRQLRRFRMCTNSIKYKTGIVFKNFLCCVRRDDSFDCFVIKSDRFPSTIERILYIIIDLESMISNISSTVIDVQTVRDGILQILDKNQVRNSENLKALLDSKNNITEWTRSISSKKIKYNTYLKQFEELLNQTIVSEKRVEEKIKLARNKFDHTNSMTSDIERSHTLSKLNSELENIGTVKRELLTNISDMKIKLSSLSLKSDAIFFDTSIMLDAIIKNISQLISM